MNRCSSCHVWFDVGVRGEERQGECRANAPKPLAVAYSDGRKTLWPLTLASEGCGQWLPAPVAQVPDVPTELGQRDLLALAKLLGAPADLGHIIAAVERLRVLCTRVDEDAHFQIATVLGLPSEATSAEILNLLRWDRDGFENISLEERRRDIEEAKRQAAALSRPLVLSDPDGGEDAYASNRILTAGDVDASEETGEAGA